MLSSNADYTHNLRHFARTHNRDTGTLEQSPPCFGLFAFLASLFHDWT